MDTYEIRTVRHFCRLTSLRLGTSCSIESKQYDLRVRNLEILSIFTDEVTLIFKLLSTNV